MILTLLPDAAPDAGVSGELLLKVIGSIFSGVLLLLGGRHLGKKESQGMKLEDPVPTVPTSRIYNPPSYHQYQALDQRVSTLERDHRELRNDLSKHFQHVLEAGQERQERIFEKIDDVARAWHSRLDQLFQPKK